MKEICNNSCQIVRDEGLMIDNKAAIMDIDAFLLWLFDAHPLQRVPSRFRSIVCSLLLKDSRPSVTNDGNGGVEVVIKALPFCIAIVALVLQHAADHLRQFIERHLIGIKE